MFYTPIFIKCRHIRKRIIFKKTNCFQIYMIIFTNCKSAIPMYN